MICLSPENPGQAALLQKICAGFDLDEGSWGYEITLRQLLTEVWLGLLDIAGSETEEIHKNKDTDEKMKAMMCCAIFRSITRRRYWSSSLQRKHISVREPVFDCFRKNFI